MTPSLVVEIPLEGIPTVYAITGEWEDEQRLLLFLERLGSRVSLDEMRDNWMQLVRDGWKR